MTEIKLVIRVKYIGYWYNEREAKDFPKPVENSASEEQIKQMLENLNRFKNSKFTVKQIYKGFSYCRICNEENSSSEYIQTVNGIRIQIPYGLEHYIIKHRVFVPELYNLYGINP